MYKYMKTTLTKYDLPTIELAYIRISYQKNNIQF